MQPSYLKTALAGMLLAFTTAASAEIETCAMDDENRVIAEQYNQRWQRALNATDSKAISDLYAESAVLMPPSDETLVGRAPIAGYLADHDNPARAADYSVELVTCTRHGDDLHVAGVWGVPATDDGAADHWRSGNVLRVLGREDDGRWVSTYEIWN